MTPEFFAVRDSVELVRFGDAISVALSRAIAALTGQIARDGIRDLVPAYTTLLIEFDPARITRAEVRQRVRDAAAAAESAGRPEPPLVEIPVRYGGTTGPDLAQVARHTGLSTDEVIRRHSGAEYTVGAVGFSPGFGYLIGLSPELATPRLTVPRLRVPAGSVAIGGEQTAVYPVETAGGWNLIGRTSRRLFDPAAPDPFLLHSGDRVRFVPVEWLEALPEAPPLSSPVTHRGIEVIAPGLLTTVQDGGRTGLGDVGIAPDGPADAAAFRVANRLVGNAPDAAALEITLTGPHLRFRQGTRIALTGEGPRARLNGQPLAPYRAISVHLGDELTFDPIAPEAGLRGYLAVRGGIDVPAVMGSRATDLTARIGGVQGRALRAGDILPVGTAAGTPRLAPSVPHRDRHVVRVVPGPQRDAFDDATWGRFVRRPWTVTNDANRVGVRLSGPALHPRETTQMISEGVVTGSVQVPGSGQPIVLLPGRATIGGYPKIATVIDADLDLLGQWRPGDVIRFHEA